MISQQLHELFSGANMTDLNKKIMAGGGYIAMALGITLACVSSMSFYFFGEIHRDYLITGAITALLASLFVIPVAIQKSVLIEKQKKKLETDEAHQLILDSIGEGLYVVDNNLKITFVNASFLKMLGYNNENEFIGKDIHSILHHTESNNSKIPSESCNIYQAFRDGKNGHGDNEVFWRADGTCFPVEYWSYPQTKNGVFTGGVVTFIDITERKKLESERIANEQKYRTLFESATDAGFIMEKDKFIDCNTAALEMFRCSREQIIGKRPYDFSPLFQPDGKESNKAAIEKITAAIDGQSPYFEWRHQRANGEEFSAEVVLNIFNVLEKNYLVAFVRDITERKKTEELIWRQANFDPLTGLPNRHMLQDRLDREIKKTQRTGLQMAIMFIDLDRFKEVNDTLGHSMGDILLKEAANRLASCVRAADTVARFGGDEFVMVVGDLLETSHVERIAQEILLKVATPFQLENEVTYISASIGITMYPVDAASIDALLKNADQAMYLAKNSGRNRYSFFTSSMQEAAQARLRTTKDLRRAIAENQFLVYYQPIVNLATGEIHKAEALIRWRHPARGIIGPDAFIAIAEETGMIVDIGNWVFHEVTRQAARWRTMFHNEFQISVNKSPVQFYYDSEHRSHQAWFDRMQTLGLPGQSIVIEITEGLLMDVSVNILNQLLEFRGQEIQLSLDDFGTGYSSLSYLKKFNINYLKIDKSFTRNLIPGSEDMALSEAIIIMAHKLQIKVIAEGIETVEQRDLLTAAGCDYGQGYLYSKPIPAEEFERLFFKS